MARAGCALLLGVERMLALFVEFVLQFQAGVIGFNGANAFGDVVDEAVHVPLAEFLGGDGTITGIVIGETRVPPDAGVKAFGKFLAVKVGAGFVFGAVEMDEVGVRDERVGG